MKPWNNNAKYCRRWHAEAAAEGLIAVTEKEFLNLQGVIKALVNHETAGPLLQAKGESEVALGCMTELGPVRMKCDRLIAGSDMIDVKVTVDASERWWSDHAWKMGYHLQAGMGLWLHNEVRQLSPDDSGVTYEEIYDWMSPKTGFLFLVVENTPPHAVNVFRASDEFIRAGTEAFMRHLRTFHECGETGVWPAFTPGVKELGVPTWVKE